jgi:uncharacterized peroxidase-related enzyme
MARISYVEDEQLSPEAREIFNVKLKGKPRNSQRMLAHRPEILKTFIDFFTSVGQGIDRRIYELVYIRVSMLNRCKYCLQHHLANSRRAGLTEKDWQGLKSPETADFSRKEKAALAFAEKLTRAPGDMTDADFEELKEFFSEAEIFELDMTAALANLTNRFTGPVGLELEIPEQEL